MQFTKQQHQVWKTLFADQLPNVEAHAYSLFLSGLKKLNLNPNKIPSISQLNQVITPQTGWETLRTKIRYSDTSPWYHHFARHQFIITNYMRSWDELQFTPEPDMFHDIFGHLPFLVSKPYTDLLDSFTIAYFKANRAQQEIIKILGWFSYEFGLIREQGQLKIFGTGLMSSTGEINKVVSGQTKIKQFTIENVIKRHKAITDFNSELFIFDSLDALKIELNRFFKTIKGKSRLDTSKAFVHGEMDMSQYSKLSL